MHSYRKPVLFSLIALATAVLGFSACSSDDNSSGTASAQFAEQYCDLMMPCCEGAGYQNDPSQCRQLFEAMGAQSFDENAANTCLEAARKVANHPKFCSGQVDADGLDACQRVFPAAGGGKAGAGGSSSGPGGSVAPGGSCKSPFDCANTSEGEGKCIGSGSDGTCHIAVPAGVGATPCYGNKDAHSTGFLVTGSMPEKFYVCDTAQGAFCDQASKTCKSLGKVGDSCTIDVACEQPGFCDSTHKCHALLAVGEACSSAHDYCAPGTYCGSHGKCEPRKQAGEPCVSNKECYAGCDTLGCSGSCDNGTCAAAGGGSGDLGLVLVCKKK